MMVVVLVEGGGGRLLMLLKILQRRRQRLTCNDVVFKFLFELAGSHFLKKINLCKTKHSPTLPSSPFPLLPLSIYTSLLTTNTLSRLPLSLT